MFCVILFDSTAVIKLEMAFEMVSPSCHAYTGSLSPFQHCQRGTSSGNDVGVSDSLSAGRQSSCCI